MKQPEPGKKFETIVTELIDELNKHEEALKFHWGIISNLKRWQFIILSLLALQGLSDLLGLILKYIGHTQ